MTTTRSTVDTDWPVPTTMIKEPATASTGRAADPAVRQTVESVIDDIAERGDPAVAEYSATFDRWSPESFRLGPDEIDRIVSRVPRQVIDDIVFAQDQVRTFATRQRESITDFEVETLPGVRLGQRHVPIRAAGAYVPGGRYRCSPRHT